MGFEIHETMILFPLIFIPFLTAIGILCLPSNKTEWAKKAAYFALMACLVWVAALAFHFPTDRGGYQIAETIHWIQPFGVVWNLGMDGLSLIMCLLLSIVAFAGVLNSFSIAERLKDYLSLYLFLVSILFGVFLSTHLFIAFIFYELSILPALLLLGIFGNPLTRRNAATKLLLFNSGGTFLALGGLFIFAVQSFSGSFEFSVLSVALKIHPFPEKTQIILAALLIAGFGVKSSFWPFHGWAPATYSSAQPSTSVLLSGAMKAIGPYLILRTAVSFFPSGMAILSPYLGVIALIGMLWTAWTCLGQKETDGLAAFSSISHIGLILLAFSAINLVSISAVVFFLFAHGLLSALSFTWICALDQRTQRNRVISEMGGLAGQAPLLGLTFVLVALAASGMPGFGNFASEFSILVGVWKEHSVLTCIAIVSLFLVTISFFRAIQNICFGPVSPLFKNVSDLISEGEKPAVFLLAGSLLIAGLYPQILFNFIEPAIFSLLSLYGH